MFQNLQLPNFTYFGVFNYSRADNLGCAAKQLGVMDPWPNSHPVAHTGGIDELVLAIAVMKPEIVIENNCKDEDERKGFSEKGEFLSVEVSEEDQPTDG